MNGHARYASTRYNRTLILASNDTFRSRNIASFFKGITNHIFEKFQNIQQTSKMKFISALFFAAAAVAPVAADTGKTEPMSIIDLAAADGKYGTLLSAVTNTPGVLDAVVASFPVTIFGPTDDAFAAIADVVASLDEATLASVLAGHVVEGVFTAQMVIDAGCVELMTLAGNQVRVMATDAGVMVNDSTVIQADIIGEGGIIHGIDTVILPGTFMPCPVEEDVSMSSKKSGGKAGSKKSGKAGSKKAGEMSGKAGSKKAGEMSGKAGSKKAGEMSGKAGKGTKRMRA